MKFISHLILMAVIATMARAASGEMIEEGTDPATGRHQRTVYSKYFDGGDWLVPDTIGVSIVMDNDTPKSRQIFGGLTGKDSDGVGTVTVYFWNLGTAIHHTSRIRIAVGDGVLESTKPFEIGPGPNMRSEHKAGQVPFFTYARKLEAKITVECDGQTLNAEIPLLRRTHEELKKYFGKNGMPPYPWYAEKYALTPEQAAAAEKTAKANQAAASQKR